MSLASTLPLQPSTLSITDQSSVHHKTYKMTTQGGTTLVDNEIPKSRRTVEVRLPLSKSEGTLILQNQNEITETADPRPNYRPPGGKYCGLRFYGCYSDDDGEVPIVRPDKDETSSTPFRVSCYKMEQPNRAVPTR